MFTSADAIQKDNENNAAMPQDAQRHDAAQAESANNPGGATAAEYSYTASATVEQNALQRRIHLAAHSDSAPQPVSGGSRSMFYYMFKCMVLKYFSKKGRASRKEYWSFVLFTLSLQMLAFYLFYVRTEDFPNLLLSLDVIGKVTLIPTVTVIIRRVHDFGKSGWWLFVPTYKIILFAFIKGDEGANQFGAPGIKAEINPEIKPGKVLE